MFFFKQRVTRSTVQAKLMEFRERNLYEEMEDYMKDELLEENSMGNLH